VRILSNKKYNDLISKQFRGIFADVNDDDLLRENGLLYGENKELKQEIERLNNIINELEKYINEEYIYDELGMKIFDASTLQDKLQELIGSDKE